MSQNTSKRESLNIPRKIYFHGAGMLTALGNGVEENLAAAYNPEDQKSIAKILLAKEEVSLPYFLIKSFPLSLGVERVFQIIDTVIEQAINEAGLSKGDLQNTGIFVGSTSFDISLSEARIKDSKKEDADFLECISTFDRFATYIADKFGIMGPAFTFNTACTSSANALIYASELIKSNHIKHALVVGLEFFNETTSLGFYGLELISKNGMRPFDKDRDGLYLGEGCSAIVLSAEPKQNGFAYLAGANLGDNYSVTGCNPDGSTIARVIRLALEEANLKAQDIAMIKAHGTASLSNDEAEAAGMYQIFEKLPPVVALKPIIGHTLGACGTNELILFYRAIEMKKSIKLPTQQNYCDEMGVKLFTADEPPVQGNFLLNYFGFGGNNTALVLSNE